MNNQTAEFALEFEMDVEFSKYLSNSFYEVDMWGMDNWDLREINEYYFA